MKYYLTLLFLVLFASSSWASCPTDIPPLFPSWTSLTHTHIRIPGTSCYFTLKFCYRVISGKVQFYIDQIMPESSDCDSYTLNDLIVAADDHFNQHILPNPCEDGVAPTIRNIFHGACAKFSIDPETHLVVMEFCSAAYCVNECKICYDSELGQNVVFDCTASVVNSPDCEASPFPVPLLSAHWGDFGNLLWPWTPGQCYLANCESQGE